MDKYETTIKTQESKVTVSAEYSIDIAPDSAPYGLYCPKRLTKVFDSGEPIEMIIKWLREQVPRERGAELVDITMVIESEAL